MIEEMEALMKKETWELITATWALVRGKGRVGCWWVYTLKDKAYGSIHRASLVATARCQKGLSSWRPHGRPITFPPPGFRAQGEEGKEKRSVARSGSFTSTGTRHGEKLSLPDSPVAGFSGTTRILS
ncbi:putative Cysteine-rich RLK (RECEPTOR-like protein kinase) 8 [Cucumis melo var. makuwa]|uniref:Cysteine-rich RLK (RECEPTOR-like protein kinase) 8 n=1 Tax=Cucumis melo var. makuwa TaxID=1194695 RepID=A0A5A7TIY4_CUCMM|nr:putative Cysteine-rich RLK (RECEPTOR-like protein kinase) 8 [Cucumis melo var. makuwa]TYK17901.1 putative Cysteine-rich RLK (RECEPTOR-like protein kinase) 8 [Cucumis melo var. makuwa]